MGVPSYFSYIVKNYPNIIKRYNKSVLNVDNFYLEKIRSAGRWLTQRRNSCINFYSYKKTPTKAFSFKFAKFASLFANCSCGLNCIVDSTPIANNG